jgi:diacylglycerol O-acyltransferase
MTDTLTALDATFLELEQLDEGALMSIGGVMVFEPLRGGGAPSLAELCVTLGVRLASLPRYSQRLSTPRTGGLAWPHWIEDEHFEIRNHVTRAALPAPGGDAELCEWIADFFSHRLDRTRPLWEMVLLEGLENGRWALAQQTHHCLVDGVGSVDVAQLLLDPEPAPDGQELPAWPEPRAQPALRAPRLDAAQPLVQAAAAGAHAVSGAVHAALHPRETFSRSRALTELIVREEVIGAPGSSLNVPIGATRRYHAVRMPLADGQAIRHALGGSVNDVALAACTAGLRCLLLARGEELPARGLRAMVPINIRHTSEQLALGNRVSSLFVDLPVAEPVAHERYRQIVASTTRLKSSGAASAATTMVDLTALVPPVLHGAIARLLYAPRLFNVTITNVPGSRTPLYAFGARLQEVHPIVPLAAEHAVGIAIFSHAGHLIFGINADRESTPDLRVLADGIERGIEELLNLVPQAAQREGVAADTIDPIITHI